MERTVSKRTVSALLILLLSCSGPAWGEGRHFLWRISKGADTLYLTGSVHVLKDSDYPLPEVMEDNFDRSAGLVEELDLGSMNLEDMQIGMYQLGSYPEGKSLKDALPPDMYAKLAVLAGKDGLDMGILDRLKPWLISMTLQNAALAKSGYSPESGVDMHFTAEARDRHKPIIGLEKPSYQVGLLAKLSDQAQQTMLLESMTEGPGSDMQMRTMVDAWKTGDDEMLENIQAMTLGHTPEVYQTILVTRNSNWMPKLESLLASGKQYFVVVGALHLVGPDGLLARFKKDGYTVEQL